MYKALVFDFDFTLGDSAAGIAASINYALGRLGYPEKEMEAIKKTIGLSLKNTFTALTQNEDEREAHLFAGYFREKARESGYFEKYVISEEKFFLDSSI